MFCFQVVVHCLRPKYSICVNISILRSKMKKNMYFVQFDELEFSG